MIRLCKELLCNDNIVRLLEFLEETGPTAYMFHTAFYEGTEHAGFTDEEEAQVKARELLRRLEMLLSNIMQ